jgi:ADP-ribosyl-[dinitrogen reductase] hydrolase
MNCMLGALVGDAAGAVLEFMAAPPTKEQVAHAMTMPGGGRMRVGRGQVTDDGELTMTLWQGLVSFDWGTEFPVVDILQGYQEWHDSDAFDIGHTCALAFGKASEIFKGGSHRPTEEEIEGYITFVEERNAFSEANGALMRASAIVAAGIDNPAWVSIQNAIEDARLSHPNQVCQEVNAIYVYACILLLRGFNIIEVLEKLDTFIKQEIHSEKVLEWYYKESLDISELNVTKHIGHVRWAFTMAMYFMRHPEIQYKDAIRLTLLKGGDTDTNAAIVGGLVACRYPIPDEMLQPVLQFDSVLYGIRRPIEFCAKYVIVPYLQATTIKRPPTPIPSFDFPK